MQVSKDGPAGVWVLIPFRQNGKIEFTENRWKLSGGGFIQGYMKIFGQESLGKPEIEANAEIASVTKFFEKNLEAHEIHEVKALLIFTSDDLELLAGDSPIPAMKLKQLKEFMRQKTKERGLGQDQLKKITALLSPAE
jgi:hypothetical protein